MIVTCTLNYKMSFMKRTTCVFLSVKYIGTGCENLQHKNCAALQSRCYDLYIVLQIAVLNFWEDRISHVPDKMHNLGIAEMWN